MADASVEAAVSRLAEAGMSREHALKKIRTNLHEALGLLDDAGIGWSSTLRQMKISTGMKLNRIKTVESAEEVTRDGI
jgi:hypothetical protein